MLVKVSLRVYDDWRRLVGLELYFSWAPALPASFILATCQITLLAGIAPDPAPDIPEFQDLLRQLDGPLFQLAETSRCRYILGVEDLFDFASHVPEIQDALPSLMPKMYAKGITVVKVPRQD